MAIHPVLTIGLSCSEADLPLTSEVFERLGRAGLDPEDLSQGALLKCARLAIQEQLDSGQRVLKDAATTHFDLYQSITGHPVIRQ